MEGFREALNALLQSALGPKEIKAYPVGGLKLSGALYAHAQAVAAVSQQIIEKHLQGLHDARELRKALYEGYDFQQDPLKVVKPLPKYLQVEFNQFKAAALKTPALRAAYLEAIRKAEAGAGMDEIEKKLKIAFYERNRYFANRIARTELHRNYTDQVARELMADDQIEYVQIRLSSKHPKTDICCRAGTLITTETGFKPVESVAMGDKVLTHRGRWQPVTQLYRRELDDTDTLVELEIQTESGRFHQVTLTPNHPVLTDQGWIPAGDLKTENIVFFSENIDSRLLGDDAFCKAPLGFLGSWITLGLKKVFSELCDGLLAWHPIRILHTFGLYIQAPKFARKIDGDIYQHFYFLLSSLGSLPQSLTSIDDCADRQNGETCQDGVCHNSGYFPRFVADRRASSKSLLERWVKKQRRKWGMFLIGNDLSKTERQANVFQKAFGTYRRFCESWFPPINSYIHYGMISSKMIVQSKGETVFNLGVAGDQSYVAGGLVVHNCDRHAKLDAYGLGPGVYPKADAPKPPFHSFCLCLIASRNDLFDAKPRFNPDAERKFLAALPADEARQVAGSWEKLARAKGGQTLEEIYNEGKDPLYRWKRVGDSVKNPHAKGMVASEIATDARNFTKGCLDAPRNKQKPLTVGNIEPGIAAQADAIGILIAGKTIALDHDYTRHTLLHHGGSNERNRGQEPITDADLAMAGAILNQAKNLKPGNPPKSKNGGLRLEVTETVGAYRYTVVYEVRRASVVVYTMFKRPK